MQSTNTVMMVRPARFGFNTQTAVSNAFQQQPEDCSTDQVHELALSEFDNFVSILKSKGVEVVVIYDTLEPHKPDAIFPNNWVTFHEDGTVILYPMQAENRRWERRRGILDLLRTRFEIRNEIDLSHYEQDEKFLEGTGSMVLDREHKIAYACYSPRTDQEVLDDFAAKAGYRAVSFSAADAKGTAIYHTNVLMCVATRYVVICMESVYKPEERKMLEEVIKGSGKEIVNISFEQMNRFAGNMLELHNNQGESLLVMSEQAFKSLNPEQIAQIEKYSTIVHEPIYNIENNGGGSARCMMAAVHLPYKQ